MERRRRSRSRAARACRRSTRAPCGNRMLRRVPLPLESVPNVSEGRDEGAIAALAEAFSNPARLLDVHVDPDHNRSVYTLVGEGDELVETLLAGIRRAAERIDLRRHVGAHPRIGAADVVPFIALDPDRESDAR